MKLACILESIDNNIATLYDFNNRKEYKVKLDEQESIIYNDMLKEAKKHEIADELDETVDPIVFYNTESDKLVTTHDENDIKLFG